MTQVIQVGSAVWANGQRYIVDSVTKAYDPQQPRVPAGSPSGGRFGSTGGGFVFDGGHPMTRDDGAWGSSHSNSRVIAGGAAELMGISGYRQGTLSTDMITDPQWVLQEQKTPPQGSTEDRATKFLTAIHDSPGANEPLYHGFEDKVGVQWTPGDTFKLPLVATSGDYHSSVGYGIKGYDHRDNQGPPTVFEFARGTKIAGYSRWKKADAVEFGSTWSEALTSGEFKITGVRTGTSSAHWKPEVVIVSLEPVSYFNPSTRSWDRT